MHKFSYCLGWVSSECQPSYLSALLHCNFFDVAQETVVLQNFYARTTSSQPENAFESLRAVRSVEPLNFRVVRDRVARKTQRSARVVIVFRCYKNSVQWVRCKATAETTKQLVRTPLPGLVKCNFMDGSSTYVARRFL